MREANGTSEQGLNSIDYSLALENIVLFGRYSFELEQMRGESIIRQASEMLTAFSVFSATLLMAVPILVSYTSVDKVKLLTWIGIAAIPLISSLCLTIMAQWRFKYHSMQNAEQFRRFIYKTIKKYQSQDQYNLQWIAQLTSMHESIERNNNRRVFLVKTSMLCFLLAIFIIILSTLSLLILPSLL